MGGTKYLNRRRRAQRTRGRGSWMKSDNTRVRTETHRCTVDVLRKKKNLDDGWLPLKDQLDKMSNKVWSETLNRERISNRFWFMLFSMSSICFLFFFNNFLTLHNNDFHPPVFFIVRVCVFYWRPINIQKHHLAVYDNHKQIRLCCDIFFFLLRFCFLKSRKNKLAFTSLLKYKSDHQWAFCFHVTPCAVSEKNAEK